MSQVDDQIQGIQSQFAAELSEATSIEQLEQVRVRFFGKKGHFKQVMNQMGSLSKEERPAFGQRVNEVKQALMSELEQQIQTLNAQKEQALLLKESIDVTIPGHKPRRGTLHPISLTIDLITQAFIGMGYQVVEGPEIEQITYNFDRLNIQAGHPSRDERDTYYLNDIFCLRTQTSPVQIRVMEHQSPPIRIICPGKVYRPDTPDATHSPVFHQIEGLVVDKGVSMSDLVGTLKQFAKTLFGEQTEIRLRPHHFPFTEPSCEVDVTCWKCGGSGCGTCKQEGFVEVLGAGMVHPDVLKNSGLDPEIYSGFAFGIGVERTAMARFNVDDIRYFYENDLRFLEQFK